MRKPLFMLAAGAAAILSMTGATAADRSTRAQDRAAKDAAEFQKAVAGLTPGKPMSCLPLSRQSLAMKGIGSKLVYRASRKLMYVNDAPGCEGVARGDTLVTRQYTGRSCRGDIAQTVDRIARFPTGSCALGDFVPYRAN
ncbi:hypothetical protein M0208_08415 [Sphingomonas sp. SUN019]|uniref:hypothetical protein n=1 Tax=Sphingomonas sp. SUN019 TaxID=2937788 RepID=UPI0021643E6C|nr:hypothetical protein [Sphingomonas sp. SUN019]UVO50539.1 hypothetical protein M0208_08415 [Sphingomonas sp. SUN019]